MDSRAAQMAGNRPPKRPMTVAKAMASASNGGVTLKANVTSRKGCQLMLDSR